ncbi:MAG: DUF308 domain-containing protein [Bacilli bacterium]|jgi:uncharacterized membrane protein HdeD (DUF308 family)|nr:DUF308 domain-containing protein [Bacilli bacterium]
MSDVVKDEQIKKAEKIWAIIRVIEAMILMTVGVLAIVYSNNPDFQKWILIILGIFLVIDGIICIIKYYFEPIEAAAITQEFISGVFEISIGVLFWLDSTEIVDLVQKLVVHLIAVICLCFALTFIIGATIGILKKQRKMWIAVTEYFFAALFIAGGVLLFVYKDQAKDTISQIVLIICGLLLVAAGIYDLVTAFLPFRRQKPKPVKAEKVDTNKEGTESKTVDAESKPHEEPKAEEKEPDQTPYNDKQINKDTSEKKDENKKEDEKK